MALECEKIDVLPSDTMCYQIDSGTIFHFKRSLPQRLYVKEFKCGTELDAKMPAGSIGYMIAHENAILFSTTNNEIYRAVFEFGRIVVTPVRYLLECETMECADVTGFMRVDKKFLCRMNDNPKEIEGIEVPPGYIDHIGALKGIHRYKAVYVKNYESFKTFALNKNITSLTMLVDAKDSRFYARDSSSFIYISDDDQLFAVDTATYKPMIALKFRGFSNISIVGVVNGVITVTGQEDGANYLLSAQAPEGYYDYPNAPAAWLNDVWKKNPADVSNMRLNNEKDYELTNDCTYRTVKNNQAGGTKSSKRRQNDKKMDNWETPFMTKNQKEISTTVNELIDKNMELEKNIAEMQNDMINGPRDNALNDMMKSNEEAAKAISRLELENEDIGKSLDRTGTLNDELEAVNEQLSEEKDALEEEVENAKKCRAAAANKKRELKKRLAELMKQNDKLCNSLAGSSEISKYKEILDENEQIKKGFCCN